MAYDPLTADSTEDVTISANTYKVTAFTDNGAAAVETNFQNSDGSWYGRRIVSGERTATMTIEVAAAATTTPAQFATFDFRGQTWVIKQVGRGVSSSGPGSLNLTLGWVSVAS